MKTPAGTFSDFRLIKGRKVAQLVIEIPIEAADATLRALGGVPNPASLRWVAIAPLNCTSENPPDARSKGVKHWPLASQIHMRCQEPTLWTFFQKHTDFAPFWQQASQENDSALGGELAAEVVRLWCGVESRRFIVPGSEPAERWYALEAEYEQWQRDAA